MEKFDKKKRGAHRRRVKGEKPATKENIGYLPMNEFRENFSVFPSHTAHIYGQQGNYYLHMNITTSPISKRGKKYIEMHKNPNNNPKQEHKDKVSFFNPVPAKSKKKFFGKPKREWELDARDEELMKEFRTADFEK